MNNQHRCAKQPAALLESPVAEFVQPFALSIG